ncbi:MAG: 5-(carboxyamino)imidazole ribonucleotide mutase [Planctomycetes bacterium]|nr:5-(carboxyamino)imidazole ribonucleotide mutase [Planctomycetota bacterium]
MTRAKESSKGRVAILMGSASDHGVMRHAAQALSSLDVPYVWRVLSAHRTPDDLAKFVDDRSRGIRVWICGAGMAAHLAGAVAARTADPVIAVPIDSGGLGGLDALLASVQMPPGVPVATVAVGEAGARNAGLLAASILAVSDEALAGRLRALREEMAGKCRAADRDLDRSI